MMNAGSPRDLQLSHAASPDAHQRRRRRFGPVASAIFVIAAIAGLVTLLGPPLLKLVLTREMWVAGNGTLASDQFRYLLFPTADSIAYDDDSLGLNPTAWDRVLLNNLPEQESRAVRARDTRSGTVRFVDGASMALLPSDPAEVESELARFVSLVGKQRERPIRSIRFEQGERDGIPLVTLEVVEERSTEIFEYSIEAGRVVPLRWCRTVPAW